MSDTILIDSIVSAEYEMVEPTAELRWKDGVLEQRVKITVYRDHRAISGRGEWRPVPSE